jgi:hypothetical protein
MSSIGGCLAKRKLIADEFDHVPVGDLLLVPGGDQLADGFHAEPLGELLTGVCGMLKRRMCPAQMLQEAASGGIARV